MKKKCNTVDTSKGKTTVYRKKKKKKKEYLEKSRLSSMLVVFIFG